jgi:hypothetical protein
MGALSTAQIAVRTGNAWRLISLADTLEIGFGELLRSTNRTASGGRVIHWSDKGVALCGKVFTHWYFRTRQQGSTTDVDCRACAHTLLKRGYVTAFTAET